MRRLIATALTLVAFSAPTFAQQSEEGMNLREMRRAQFFMMKQMVDAHMNYMKSQEEMLNQFSKMLQKMLECENNNTRDGQAGC